MQNPLIIGCIVFLILLAGAFASWTIRQRLPEHHLTDDTKSLVSVSMAVVATVSALVLGLLISNANTSFRALGGDVTTLSAQILRLDNILRRYGPDTYPARETLRQYAEQKTADLFPDEGTDVRLDNPSTYALLQRLEDSMLELKPSNPRDQAQWALKRAALLTPMASTSNVVGGILLIMAGLYQWSPLKDTCLAHCQAPLLFIQSCGGFRRNVLGALEIGVLHGAYCVGCCWVLMTLLFVGGVMNVLWIAAIARSHSWRKPSAGTSCRAQSALLLSSEVGG